MSPRSDDLALHRSRIGAAVRFATGLDLAAFTRAPKARTSGAQRRRAALIYWLVYHHSDLRLRSADVCRWLGYRSGDPTELSGRWTAQPEEGTHAQALIARYRAVLGLQKLGDHGLPNVDWAVRELDEFEGMKTDGTL
jgi:hypothetical protein